MAQADKVQDLLGGSGERVEAAAIAFRAGGVRGVMKRLGGWMALLRDHVPEGEPSLPLPDRIVVALTDRRLLVYSLGGSVVAAPKKLLYDFARSDLVCLEQPEIETGVAMALRVGAVFAGGSVLRFEFPRAAVAEGTRILDALAADLRPPGEAHQPLQP